MTTPAPQREDPRILWALAGLAAGVAGLAVSYAAALALTVRESPVVAVAEAAIRLTPGAVAEWAIRTLGHWDKPVLVVGILVLLGVLFLAAGLLTRRAWVLGVVIFAALAGVGLAAVLSRPGATTWDAIPLVAGFATWLVALSLLSEPLRRLREQAGDVGGPGSAGSGSAGSGSAGSGSDQQARDRRGLPAPASGEVRRSFLLRAGVLGVLALGSGVLGRFLGRGRRHVEKTRDLLRLERVTRPRVPADARIGLEGVSPWMTKAEDFYLIHTAIAIPTIDPDDWRLRIHGLVEREVVLTYQDLVDREITEAWVTLNCVSNPVGGSLVGNAWWSGVRLADILAVAGPLDGADCVLQTSDDGWNCGTPLAALTDPNRNAMLAVAMNGAALPIEHGFPVRTIVPGLYGYVSACKWVVDLEVTRFADVSAYWTERGWGEQGPVKLASRIDVPGSGDEVPAGQLHVGGVAWRQHVGVEAVEVALDGGAWQPAVLAGVPEGSAPDLDTPDLDTPNLDTWVQWAVTVDVAPGDHVVRVRAKERGGDWQTGVQRDVLPDGATGWHEVDFTAT